jgi:hypothetical protein
VPKAGGYRVTMSENAWLDVIQDGKALKPSMFGDVVGCAGLRKSVEFELTSAPFVIEVSGVAGGTFRSL